MSLLATLGLKPHATVNDSRARQHAVRLLAKLEQGAWHEVEQALGKASEESRELLLRGIADEDNAVPAASRWVQAQPRCALAQLLLGVSLVADAWKIRGGAYAEDVDAGAWEPFHRTLQEAEVPLQAAAELDENLADAHAWLIVAEVAGEGDRDRLKTLFRTAIARSPLHWGAHYRYFMVVAEKWGGSHKEMFGYARAVTSRSPKGRALHCLLAAAYCEYALDKGSKARDAIRSPQCAAELKAALYAWLEATPATLEARLADVADGVGELAMNHFAVACYLVGANAEAKILLDALRGEIQSIPWAWIAEGPRERSDPGFVHDRVKRELGRA